MSEATTKAALMTEHRDYIDGYAAGLADGRRIAPQPAVPVVSDEQIRKTVESIKDPDTVHAFHNGYYTLTPDELRRAILALRPHAVPMTPDHIWANDGIMSANGIIGFKFDAVIRIVRAVEAHHGITAKAEVGA